ncbi:MAG: hypothetical protein Q9203_005884, partial [Teloschistes exilis]
AAYRGLKPQTALMRAASGMSRTIDPRRPRKLNLAQQAEVDRHPEVKLLRRRRKSLLQAFRDQKRSIASTKGTLLYDHYRQVYQAHRNLKRRYEKALLTEVKSPLLQTDYPFPTIPETPMAVFSSSTREQYRSGIEHS